MQLFQARTSTYDFLLNGILFGATFFILGLLVDKDELINYQLLTIYGLLLRIFTYRFLLINQLLIRPSVISTIFSRSFVRFRTHLSGNLMPRGPTLTRQWEKVEVMKRKTGNLRTTMRMDRGLELLPRNSHTPIH
jgi:hypothetical protein